MADKTITGPFEANTYYETTPIVVSLSNSFPSHAISLEKGTGVKFESYRYIEFKAKIPIQPFVVPRIVVSSGTTILKSITGPSLNDGQDYSTYRINTALLLDINSISIHTDCIAPNGMPTVPVDVNLKDFKFGTSNTGFNYVSVTTMGDGTTNPEPDTYIVSTGESFTVTAIPASGKAIENVFIDNVAQINASPSVALTNVTTNKNIAFSFNTATLEYHTVTISKSASGGTVNPEGAVKVTDGGSLKITVNPASGYKVAGINVNGVYYESFTEYELTNVKTDYTVFASFAAGTQTTIPITITKSGNGSGTTFPTTLNVLPVRDATVSFTPSADSYISKVTIDGIDYEPTEVVTFTKVVAPHAVNVEYTSKFNVGNLVRVKRGQWNKWLGNQLVDGELGYDRTNNQLRIGNALSPTDFGSCPIIAGGDGGKVKINDADTTAGYLDEKIILGANLTKTIVHPTVDTTAIQIAAIATWGNITGTITSQTDLMTALAARALVENGVTGGDTHNHTNGHGAQIAYNSLSGLPILGSASARNVGTGANEVAAGNHVHNEYPIAENLGKIKISSTDPAAGFFTSKVLPSSTIELIGAVDGTTGFESIQFMVKSGIFEPVFTKNSAFNKNFGTNTGNLRMDGTVSVGSIDEVARIDHIHPTDTSRASATHNHDTVYAPITKGVTNGDSHDHNGGDGAQIDYANLANKPTLGTAATRNAGVANGLAELGSNGKVLPSQLPSSLNDIQEFANLAAFPATGSSSTIYIALDTNRTYRWTGTQYIEISSSLALGETNLTAYRGDRGKTAYDHSQSTHAPSNAQKNSDITKAEIEAKLTGEISTHTHANSGTVTGPISTTPNTVSIFGDATGKVIAEAAGVLYHPAGSGYNAGLKFITNRSDIDCGINSRNAAGHSILQIANNINTTYFGNIDTSLPGCLVRLDTRNTRRYGLFNVHTRAAGSDTYERPFIVFPAPSGSIVVEPSGNVQMGWDSETSTDLGFKLSVNGIINASGHHVVNVADPFADNDAANKRYVDSKTGQLGNLTNKKVWIGDAMNEPVEKQAAELPAWQGGKYLVTTETEGILSFADGSSGGGSANFPSGSPGDMLVCTGGETWVVVPIGTAGQILIVGDDGLPSWQSLEVQPIAV